MAYTINTNAKNVWIRDNEDTRDLSIQTDASSVYLDNGRTLEQELGEGSMVSNVATVDTSMSKIIDGTLDGAYESLIFKGRTLVNLANKSQENAHYTDYNLSYIDKTKTYFIKVISTKAIVKIGFIVNNTTWNNSVDCEQITNGYVIIKPNETLEVGGLRVITSDSTTSYTLKTMIIEYQQGMEEWDIPYFEGLCDSKMPILQNVGKNLWNDDLVTVGCLSYRANSCSLTRNSDHSFTVVANDTDSGQTIMCPVFLKANHTYKITCTITGEDAWLQNIVVGDKNLTRFDATSDFNGGQNIDRLITPSRDVYYVQLNGRFSQTTKPTTFNNIQIEESSISTSYEPYKTNILRTSEEIVLRSLPNGVCDTLNVETGEYVQRIGEVIKNNATGFILSTGGWENKSDVCTFEHFKPKGMKVQEAKDKPTLNCDKVPSNTFSTQWNNSKGIESITQHGGGGIVLSITRDKLLIQDVDGLNTYLQSNPLTIQYELAEPITTIIEPLTIPFAYENGHIILESGSEGQSLLPTLEYSTVVNRTGQVEGVAKVIQKQEKQLTMLEQMLIQNIIGLDYSNTVLALNLEINEVM